MERAIPTFPCRDLDSASAFYQSSATLALAIRPTPSSSAAPWSCTCQLFEALEPKTNCSASHCAWRTPRRSSPGRGPRPGRPGDSTHPALRPALGYARIRPGRSRRQPAAGRPGARSTPEQHRFAWPAPTTSPRWPPSVQINVREAGETLDAGDQQAIRHCSWPPRATACSGWRRPSSIPAVRPRPLGRSRTVRHGSEIAELYVLPTRRQGLARELVGSAEEACARGAPA